MKKEPSSYQPKFWKPIKNEDIILNKSLFNNFGFDKHVHEEFGIGVISQGFIDGFIDGQTRTINKNSIMTINPDTAHSNWSHNQSSYSQSALYLTTSFLKNIAKEHFHSDNIYFKSGLLENEQLANEFVALANAYENQELSELDYECRLVELLKKILLQNSKVIETPTLKKHDLAILRAKEFMHDNLSDDLTLDDISKALDISKYHFLRLFKEQTHFSTPCLFNAQTIGKSKAITTKRYLSNRCSLSLRF